MTIEERYQWACDTPSDINLLIPVLRNYGEQCNHITEFGVRDGVSTSAWLVSHPEKLICYDIGHYPSVDEIARLAKGSEIEFEFHKSNTANVVIEETDLLFIDTIHNGNQLANELVNRSYVNKFIIIHDTDTYGIEGESGAPGLWESIIPLLNYRVWKLLEHRPESNGLTVLQRITPCP